MNATERLAALDARHTAERADLERELALVRLVPDPLARFSLSAHPHRLWDRVGTLHFKYERYESLRKGAPVLTLPDLREVLATFPADVPCALYRDGCTSFRSLANAEAALDQAEARGARAGYDVIAPFWIQFDAASFTYEARVEWLTSTPLGIVEVSCSFPLYVLNAVATVQVLRTGPVTAQNPTPLIRRTDLHVSPRVHVLGSTKAEYLRRPHHDGREPGALELYWDACGDRDAAMEVTPATLLDALQ